MSSLEGKLKIIWNGVNLGIAGSFKACIQLLHEPRMFVTLPARLSAAATARRLDQPLLKTVKP